MALKFQYNKTFLQQLNKELKVREKALPTLQAKEAALRVEVKKAKQEVGNILERLRVQEENVAVSERMWKEFPDALLAVDSVEINIKKIAGVKTPILDDIHFKEQPFSLFSAPGWVSGGVSALERVVRLRIQKKIAEKKVSILEYARKKTTQKVNLYEKVQIPEYVLAIRKIKGFLEDEENLAKSSQKILKQRILEAEEAAQ